MTAPDKTSGGTGGGGASKPGLKRVYAEASAAPLDGGFTVRLDQRPVRTPARRKLIVPTLALAEGLAAEWAAQGEVVRPADMPLNRMAQSAIDLIAANRDGVVSEIATYGGTDMLCYRADQPRDLVQRQDQAWGPWIEWSAEVFGARLTVTEGVIAARQPPEALERLKQAVRLHDPFGLAALQMAVTLTGSLVLGLALSRGALAVEEAIRLAELDEMFQVERWGDDDEARRRRERNRRDLAAANRFFRLLA